MDLTKIEDKLDKTVIGATEISMEFGGIKFVSMSELFEMAKLVSLAGSAVPKHLRGNPGACLAVCVQALEWKFSPFAVANKSYEVNDRIAYEAQLIVAVINARAPLKERLRYTYEGEGTEMSCTVSGLMNGEATPLTYTTPKIKDIKVKNSPLWTSDPQQQLAFYAGRAWARRHCPETILGIYSDDELRDAEPMQNGNVATIPDVGKRLRKKDGARGFGGADIERALEHKPRASTVENADTPALAEVEVNATAPQSDEIPSFLKRAAEQRPVKQALHDAETMTQRFCAGFRDADIKTPDDVDELRSRARDCINACEIEEDEKSVLLGTLNAAYLQRKKAFSAGKCAA